MYFETKRSIDRNYIYTQSDENLSFVSHVHNSYEFITVLEGELECSVYDETFILKSGKAMLVLPNHVHAYKTDKFSRSFLCVFSSDYVSEFYNETKNGSWSGMGGGGNGVYAVFDFVDRGEIDLLKNEKTNRFMQSAVLYGICGRAYENIAKCAVTGTEEDLTIKLLYYIQQNYDKVITLKNLANEMGYNYTYLSNIFNKIFGCGFSKFVNNFRVNNAAELLRTTNKSMVQISNACGFESIRSFNEQFKQNYGVTPSDYRARSSKE